MISQKDRAKFRLLIYGALLLVGAVLFIIRALPDGDLSLGANCVLAIAVGIAAWILEFKGQMQIPD